MVQIELVEKTGQVIITMPVPEEEIRERLLRLNEELAQLGYSAKWRVKEECACTNAMDEITTLLQNVSNVCKHHGIAMVASILGKQNSTPEAKIVTVIAHPGKGKWPVLFNEVLDVLDPHTSETSEVSGDVLTIQMSVN